MDLVALGAELDLLEREVRCPVCLDCFKEPFAFPCNHLFCKECLLQAIKITHACPVCKIPYFKRDMRKIPVLEGVTEIYQRIREMYTKVAPPKPVKQIKPFKPWSPRRSPGKALERQSSTTPTVLNLVEDSPARTSTRRSSHSREAAPAPTSIDLPSRSRTARTISVDEEISPQTVIETPRRPARSRAGDSRPTPAATATSSTKRKLTTIPDRNASLPLISLDADDADDSLLNMDLFAPPEKKRSNSNSASNSGAIAAALPKVNHHPANHGTVKTERSSSRSRTAKSESPELAPALTLRLSISDDEDASAPLPKRGRGRAPHTLRRSKSVSASREADGKNEESVENDPASGSKDEAEEAEDGEKAEEHEEESAADDEEEEKEEGSPRTARRLVFLHTGINEDRQKLLKRVASLVGAKVVHKWGPSVTHVVTESKHSSARTINDSGLEACSEAAKLVDESKYEVESDRYGAEGPRRGRLRAERNEEPLFHSLKFHFAGSFDTKTGPSKAEFIKLVELGGAEVLRSMPRGSEPKLKIICDEESLAPQLTAKLGARTHLFRSTWILDCISSYTILTRDISKYQLT